MRISRRELGCILPAALAGWPLTARAITQCGRARSRITRAPTARRCSEPAQSASAAFCSTPRARRSNRSSRGFERKYPFLKVTVQRGTQADIARRALEEYRVGYRKLDMFELSSEGLILIRDANILQPFRSPEAAAFDAAAIEPARHWVVVRESYTGIGSNTKAIPPARAPKNYDDLLAPEWRGRMAMSGSISTASNFVATLVLTRGEDFVRRLGEQNIRIYPVTARALANLMISGEVALSPTIYNSHVEASAARGAPLRLGGARSGAGDRHRSGARSCGAFAPCRDVDDRLSDVAGRPAHLWPARLRLGAAATRTGKPGTIRCRSSISATGPIMCGNSPNGRSSTGTCSCAGNRDGSGLIGGKSVRGRSAEAKNRRADAAPRHRQRRLRILPAGQRPRHAGDDPRWAWPSSPARMWSVCSRPSIPISTN